MDLYLVRHAIAFAQDEWRWPDDSLRPVSPGGEERFRVAARGLATLVPSVELHLASPFARAWRTAELLVEEAGWPAPHAAEELGAGRPLNGSLALLSRSSPTATVALVGHEPDLSRLASYLLAGSAQRLMIDLKKGSVLRLFLPEGTNPGSGVLRFHLQPKALRKLAR